MDNNMEKEVNEKKKLIVTDEKWENITGLNQDFHDALYAQYDHPSRIQSYSLRRILDKDKKNYNFLIKSVNGSGKTLIFSLPALQIINITASVKETVQNTNQRKKQGKNEQKQDQEEEKEKSIYLPQAIIICENDVQVDQVKGYIKRLVPESWADLGQQNPVNFLYAQKQLEYEGQILVTTVHLLYQLSFKTVKIKFDNIKFLAIDECDAIFQNNQDDIISILKKINDIRRSKDRENRERDIRIVATSATWDPRTQKLLSKVLHKTLNIGFNVKINKVNVLHGVSQYYYQLSEKENNHEFICQILNEIIINQKIETQIIIFVNSKLEAQDLKKYMEQFLQKKNLPPIKSDFISSEIKKNQERVDKVQRFKNKEFQIMFSTNIMARGIDIRTVGLVINMGVPREKAFGRINHAIYLHRVARTGRFIDMGVALTLLNPYSKDQQDQDDKIIHLVKKFYDQDMNKFENPEKFGADIKAALINNSKNNLKQEPEIEEKEEVDEDKANDDKQEESKNGSN